MFKREIFSTSHNKSVGSAERRKLNETKFKRRKVILAKISRSTVYEVFCTTGIDQIIKSYKYPHTIQNSHILGEDLQQGCK